MRLSRDIIAGLLLVGLGTVVALSSASYGLGTFGRLGPGGFPFGVGVALAVLGMIQLYISWPELFTGGVRADFRFGRLLVLLAAVVAFGLLIRPLGLIPAVIALTVIGRLAGSNIRPGELLVTVVTLVLLSVGVFYFGLSMPIKLGPW